MSNLLFVNLELMARLAAGENAAAMTMEDRNKTKRIFSYCYCYRASLQFRAASRAHQKEK